MANEFVKHLETNIQALIADGKFREARNMINQFLAKSPRDRKLIALKSFVEKNVNSHNDRLINTELKKIKPLWKEKNYQQILKNLSPLLKIAPKNEKLIKTYSKAQKKYKAKLEKDKKNFLKDQKQVLDKLLKENGDKLVKELLELEMKNPGNQIVQALSKDYRDKLIAQEIEKHKDLIFSDKFDVINNFLQKLLKIDKNNERIKELYSIIKKRQYGTQVEEKNEFVYQGQQHLDTLIKLKKYDKAIRVALEILSVDKDNKPVQKILKTAKRKNFNTTRNQVIKQIISEKEKSKQEYQNNRDQFLKI